MEIPIATYDCLYCNRTIPISEVRFSYPALRKTAKKHKEIPALLKIFYLF